MACIPHRMRYTPQRHTHLQGPHVDVPRHLHGSTSAQGGRPRHAIGPLLIAGHSVRAERQDPGKLACEWPMKDVVMPHSPYPRRRTGTQRLAHIRKSITLHRIAIDPSRCHSMSPSGPHAPARPPPRPALRPPLHPTAPPTAPRCRRPAPPSPRPPGCRRRERW